MPQSSSQSEDIGGVKYEVFMLNPSAAIKLLSDIGKVCGPAIASISDGDGATNIGLAAKMFFSNLEDSTVQRAIKTLANVTHADGAPLEKIWEVHFMGRIGKLFEWFVFALETQYADLPDALRSGSRLRMLLQGAQ